MNKNTSRLRRAAHVARKAGQAELAIEMPAGGYHNYDAGIFATRRVPLARRGKDGVVSANPHRNTQMRVLQNEGGGSITSHEPINKSVPVWFKNHGYLANDERERNQYRQHSNVRH